MRDEFEFFGNAASAISQLLEKTVEAASRTSDDTLVLKFSNKITLEVLKTEYVGGYYESYQIIHNGQRLVV